MFAAQWRNSTVAYGYALVTVIALLCSSSYAHDTRMLAFVYGPASIGKTALSHALQELDSSWKIIDEDKLYHEYTVQQCAELLPNEYCCIAQVIERHNIFPALKFDQISWKKNSSKDDQEVALRAIHVVRCYLDDPAHKAVNDDLFEKLCAYERDLIRQYTDAGYHVLVDGWVLKSMNSKPYPDNCTVVSVLMYCSLDMLIKRVPGRNKRAFEQDTLGQVRFFRHSLINFNQKYVLKTGSDGALDCLLRTDVEDVFSFVRSHLTVSAHAQGDTSFFSRGEFTQEQLDAHKELFLKNFVQDVMYVFPRSCDDLVIPTHQKSPHECARMIIDYAAQRA